MSHPSRTVILHCHLFKNAGTSLDHILKQNFADRWVTREFDMGKGGNTGQVENWILSSPKAVAFSSHTMTGPLPSLPDIEIVPILLLRDPLSRIRSAYRFERSQQADTFGAKLAKVNDLAGYVSKRLSNPQDRQCKSFQAWRLAMFCPGPEAEYQRAKKGAALINETGVLGLVEAFDQTLAALQCRIRGVFPDFAWQHVHANPSAKTPESHMDRALLQQLEDANADDLNLLRYAQELLCVDQRND
jgi:hypothetical protein